MTRTLRGISILAGAALVVGLTADTSGSIDRSRSSVLDIANRTGSSAIFLAYADAQATAAPATQQSCGTNPGAPGCEALATMAKAIGEVLQTCTKQPDAGVCPQVTGPNIQPPGNPLDPGQLRTNAPADRLWLYSPGSKKWLTITPPVLETCQKDPAVAGCTGVQETLNSVGRFQTACREQPGSPACGGSTAPSAPTPELTGGTPTTSAGRLPIFMNYLTASFSGGGAVPLDDVTLIGPPQPPTGPLEPLSLFAFSTMNLSGTPVRTEPPPPIVTPGVVPSPAIAGIEGTSDRLFTRKIEIPSLSPNTVTTPAVPTIDLVQSADTFQVTSGGLNQSIQLMIVVTINQMMQAGGKDDDYASRFVVPRPVFRAVAWETSPRGPSAAVESPLPMAILPLRETTQQKSPVQVFITSLGTSTGEAFEMQAFSADGAPVQLRGEGLVVQPLNDDNARRTQQEMVRQAKSAGARTSSRLIGYCLEFLRLPPSKGMMFQVANNSLQQKFAPMRRIVEASRLVRAAGQLVPDSEPEGYFHSISQWAIWTREQNFNQRSYGDAFVGHTRKNFEQAGGKWSGAVEQVVRKVVPNRWNDITKILQRAGTL